MKKVIISLSLVLAVAVYGAGALFSNFPKGAGNSVIAEKTDSKNSVAILLPDDISPKQGQLLNSAYEIAKEDGHKNPELVQAVLLQETLAGGMLSYKVANPGPNAYFGVMQIKLEAAKDVLSKFPELFKKYDIHTRTDDEIKANLILNDLFNIEVASKYLLILQKTYGFSGRDLLNAYNRGPGGVRLVSNNYHYAIGAEQKLKSYKANL